MNNSFISKYLMYGQIDAWVNSDLQLVQAAIILPERSTEDVSYLCLRRGLRVGGYSDV